HAAIAKWSLSPPCSIASPAASSASLVVARPSAYRSPTSTTLRSVSPIQCQRLRQQATANSLAFRSLTLSRRNSSIGCRSVQASHSASVIASPSATSPACRVSALGLLGQVTRPALPQPRDQRLILSSGRAAWSSFTPASVTLVPQSDSDCKLLSCF